MKTLIMAGDVRDAAVAVAVVLALVAHVAAAPGLFNLGPDGLDEIEGWTHAGTMAYDPARGWGWETVPDTVRQRGVAPNPVEDTAVGVSARGNEAVFRVDGEPGLYEVSICMGDARNPANTRVFLNNDRRPWIDRGVTPAGVFVRTTRTTYAPDGIVRLRIPSRGVAGEPYNMVNWLWVQRVDPHAVPGLPNEVLAPVNPRVPGFEPEDLRMAIARFPVPLESVARVAVPADGGLVLNFGPDGTDVPAGVVNTGTSGFDAARGWGWLVPADAMRQRNVAPDPLLDTMAGVSGEIPVAEFAVVLEPGAYRVEAVMNDPQHRYNAELFLNEEKDLWISEGVQPAGQALVRSRTVELADGVLRIRIPAPVAAGTPFTMLSHVRVTPIQ